MRQYSLRQFSVVPHVFLNLTFVFLHEANKPQHKSRNFLKTCLLSAQIYIFERSSANWPFPSSPGPLYRNEVKCSAFDMEEPVNRRLAIFVPKQRACSQANVNTRFFILMQIKLIFQERLCPWSHFEKEGFWNSELAYNSLPPVSLGSEACLSFA